MKDVCDEYQEVEKDLSFIFIWDAKSRMLLSQIVNFVVKEKKKKAKMVHPHWVNSILPKGGDNQFLLIAVQLWCFGCSLS